MDALSTISRKEKEELQHNQIKQNDPTNENTLSKKKRVSACDALKFLAK